MKNLDKEDEKFFIVKDCEVEVFSEEEGYIGFWYRVIFEEIFMRLGCKKFCVCYIMLFEEDCLIFFIEIVEERFIRLVLFDDLSVVFEEGLVVDVDYNDGWWKGVIIKKMEEDDKFLVYFDFLLDMIQFEKK